MLRPISLGFAALLLLAPLAIADSPSFSLPTHEQLSFVLRWGVVTGGHATLKIEGIEPFQDKPAFHLTSYAHSTGVVDTFYHVEDHSDAWVDTQTLVTYRYQKTVREGKYHLQEGADFAQQGGYFVQQSFRFDKKRSEMRVGDLPAGTRDVFGSLYYIRTLPLAVGESYTFNVLSGDKLWPMVVKVKRREKVKVRAGRFDCFVVEPELRQPGIFVTKGKKVEVWLTADERHMPVRMRSEVVIGHVAAELEKYQ